VKSFISSSLSEVSPQQQDIYFIQHMTLYYCYWVISYSQHLGKIDM